MRIRVSLSHLVFSVITLTILTAMRLQAQNQPDESGGTCSACVPCFDGGHALITGYSDLIGSPHSCTAPACPGPHSACGTYGFRSPAEVETQVIRLAMAGPDSLGFLLRPFGASVRLNRERRQILFVNCQEQVVAQVPLDSDMLDLADRLIIAARVGAIQLALR